MCIFDLNKTLMNDFNWNYIKTNYGNGTTLLLTDTDSVVYDIQTNDVYADITEDVDGRFDTSEYPKDHLPGIRTGVDKKVIEMYKDEVAGKQIEEFVGLRAKLYSHKMFDGDEHKKCKGIRRSVIKKTINTRNYKETLFSCKKQYKRMNVIRSHLHDVYTEEINKVAHIANDDKRITMDDGINTLAYGLYLAN